MTLTTTPFGPTGRDVTRIGFGAWAIGGSWGDVSEGDAKATLSAALDAGMSFIDTADVYGDGRSERIIRDVLKTRSDRPFVANIEAFIDRSLTNLGVDCLDLVQLHCPPTEVYYTPALFDGLEALKAKGKIAAWGVSVEKVEEGLKAIDYPGCASVQIIYNIFRQRPAALFLREAQARGVAVIARVPLASGMLTGKMTKDSAFAADDHRAFNRHGEAFDMGETFSGVPYDVALQAVEELRPLMPQGASMAGFARRWILMSEAVTVVIPGARTPAQSLANAGADAVAPLPASVMEACREVYQRLIAPHVHQRW